MHVETLPDFHEYDDDFDPLRVRDPDFPQDWADGRIAVVACDVHDPFLDHRQGVLGNPLGSPGIIDSKVDRATVGVRKGNHFAGHSLRIGGKDGTLAESELLEFREGILPRLELIANRCSRIHHRSPHLDAMGSIYSKSMRR